MDQAWWAFLPSPVVGGWLSQVVLAHKPPRDAVIVWWTAAAISVYSTWVLTPRAGVRSFGGFRAGQGTSVAQLPAESLKQASPGWIARAWAQQRALSKSPPPPSPIDPCQLSKAWERQLFYLLNPRGLLRMQRGFLLLFPCTLLLQGISRWRLPFICKYLEPINSPVPATYPPCCKTLSVPSKWQTEVPSQLELLQTWRHVAA